MLSIIIPTLNEEKYLPRLLDSIRVQSFSDYEVIVSDGGSLDKTREIALASHCVFTVDREHHHPSWQRNNGAALARGDILLFIDSDSVLPNNFLEKALAEFIKNDLVGGGFYISFNPDKFSYRVYAVFFNAFCWCRQYFAPAAAGVAILARKTAHKAINGFDTSLYIIEDFDYTYRLSSQGKFRMIKSIKVLFSARRMKEESESKMLLKWLGMAAFSLFNIKMKKKVVKYEFGQHQ